jgi:hypothetical protein
MEVFRALQSCPEMGVGSIDRLCVGHLPVVGLRTGRHACAASYAHLLAYGRRARKADLRR